MKTLLRVIFCAFVFSERILDVQGTVYATPDTALRFSQCLIEKISESNFFTVNDRNSMIEVAKVMSQAMQQRRQFSGKILVVAFVTSMADVVITENPSRNNFRKGTYAAALEQCSLSSVGYVDVEFIKEALRILTSLEESKVPKFQQFGQFGATSFSSSSVETYGAGMIPQGTEILNPFAVQPSPVQIMNDQRLLPNVRTDYQSFEDIKYAQPSAPTQFGFNSQSGLRPAGDMRFFETGGISQFGNSPIQPGGIGSVQPGTYESSLPQAGNIPPGSIESTMVQPGGFALGYDTSQSQSKSTFSDISSTNNQKDGINVPQTKESSVVVIPPESVHQDGNPAPEFDQTAQAFNPETASQPEGEDSRDSSAILPQTDEQVSNNPSSPTLENFVLNILTNSSSFRDVFNPNMPKENAINLARAITQQSLSGFDIKIVDDAVASVANEVAKVSFNSPENYALALSNGLVSVLKLHNLPQFIDGSQLATGLLSSLDSIQQDSSQTGDGGKESISDVPDEEYSVPSEGRKTDFDFQNPPLSPADMDEERFSLTLARALSNSEVLSIFFCSDVPVNRLQTCFNMVKFSLIDFGPQISSIAASTASSTLSDLSGESLCLNYAKTISEIIAEVLEENGIHGANFEDMSNKMAFSLQQQIPNIESLKPTTISNVPTTSKLPVSHQTTPALQYSTYSNESAPFNPNQTPVMEQTQSDYQVSSGSTNPVTPVYSTTISDEELTTIMALLSSSESPTTESSLQWAPGGVVNETALADYLIDAFESKLDAYNSNGTDKGVPSASSESNVSTMGTFIISDDAQPAVPGEIPSSGEGIPLRNNQNRQRKRKRKTTVSQSGTMSSPSVQAVDYDEGNQNSQKQQSDDNVNVRESSQQYDYEVSDGSISGSPPRDFNSRKPIVELQPSFQGPVSQPADARQVPQINSGTVTDYEYVDPSIAVARQMSQIAASTITYIRTQELNMPILCAKINTLAPLVGIEPLDYCEEIAAMDYLLSVIKADATKKLKEYNRNRSGTLQNM